MISHALIHGIQLLPLKAQLIQSRKPFRKMSVVSITDNGLPSIILPAYSHDQRLITFLDIQHVELDRSKHLRTKIFHISKIFLSQCHETQQYVFFYSLNNSASNAFSPLDLQNYSELSSCISAPRAYGMCRFLFSRNIFKRKAGERKYKAGRNPAEKTGYRIMERQEGSLARGMNLLRNLFLLIDPIIPRFPERRVFP